MTDEMEKVEENNENSVWKEKVSKAITDFLTNFSDKIIDGEGILTIIPEKYHDVVGEIVKKTPMLKSTMKPAKTVADEYKQKFNGDIEKAVKQVKKDCIAQCAIVGGVTAAPSVIPGAGTISEIALFISVDIPLTYDFEVTLKFDNQTLL
ncbi:MAG: hypothetical protein LBM13_02965 [Candidatus Ancillula sp.]|jgi:hypothetical protein|nr:hypothetical protein [Candidatus Ancillula sp.]